MPFQCAPQQARPSSDPSRRHRRARRAALLAAALLGGLATATLPAAAQETAPGAPAGGSNLGTSIPNPATVFSGGGAGALLGVGINNQNGDWYAQTLVNFDFSIGPVGVGLALPLSFLVVNDDQVGCAHAPPCTRDDKTYFSALRKQDWNQPADYARFVRYLRYGQKRDPFYFLIGQEWGSSIGHGTLVNRYNNALNLNLNKVGIALDVNTTWAGVETLTDNVVSPNLLASRLYLRPFGDTPVLRGLAVGGSIAADLHAPRTLNCGSATVNVACPYQPGGNPPPIAIDPDKSVPLTNEETQQLAFGADLEYELLSNSLIHLLPYIDGNRLVGGGNGLHLGIMTQIAPPIPLLDVRLDARLEYRVMQAGYIPEYFDQLYDLGRYQYSYTDPAGRTSNLPKAQVARLLKSDPTSGNQGYYGELAFNFGGFVTVGGTLQDYQVSNGTSLGLYATIPKIQLVKVQGYYLRKNFGGLSDAFTLDERSLLGGSLAYKVLGPLYLMANYQRAWVLNPGASQVQATNSYSFGLATFLPFGGGAAATSN
jgi:hypothetical protein